MRALIYGHSQSEGMGLDVERLLKQKGVEVVRVTKRGYNDRRLIKDLPTLPPGPYDRVYLYAGGNSDKPSVGDIRSLIQSFGAERTVVVLAPANLDHAERYPISHAKIEGNKAGIADLVRVYAVEAPGADFYSDKIHMKPGSATSRQLAEQIVAETLTPGAVKPARQSTSMFSVAAGFLLLIGLWRRFGR